MRPLLASVQSCIKNGRQYVFCDDGLGRVISCRVVKITKPCQATCRCWSWVLSLWQFACGRHSYEPMYARRKVWELELGIVPLRKVLWVLRQRCRPRTPSLNQVAICQLQGSCLQHVPDSSTIGPDALSTPDHAVRLVRVVDVLLGNGGTEEPSVLMRGDSYRSGRKTQGSEALPIANLAPTWHSVIHVVPHLSRWDPGNMHARA